MNDFENRYYARSKLSKQKNFYIPNQMMTIMYPQMKTNVAITADQLLKQSLLKLAHTHTIHLANANANEVYDGCVH